MRVCVHVQDNTMERVVLPFSGLASWVLILGGILATLQVLGINIQPLLTVGGVSGIVVGLSAQSVMSNMISGINLVSPCNDHHQSAFVFLSNKELFT